MISKMLSKYICLEAGFNRINKEANWIEFKFQPDGDHRGFYSSIYIYGFGWEFNIYDVRHEEESGQEFDYCDMYGWIEKL